MLVQINPATYSEIKFFSLKGRTCASVVKVSGSMPIEDCGVSTFETMVLSYKFFTFFGSGAVQQFPLSRLNNCFRGLRWNYVQLTYLSFISESGR